MTDSLQGIGDMAVAQSTAPHLSRKLMSAGNIDKTSKDFESMFMTQMLQPMFEGIGSDPLFGGGHGEEVMKTFLIQEYGKVASQSGNLGIAASVKTEMLKAQSNASAAGATRGGTYASVQ